MPSLGTRPVSIATTPGSSFMGCSRPPLAVARRHPVLRGDTDCNELFALRNCTVRGGYFAISRQSADIGRVKVTILDSAFDGGVDIFPPDPHSSNASLTHYDYNAYLSGGETNLPSGAHDIFVTNFNWQTSWLGNFYLPSDSTLTNAGSTYATNVALYHFTMMTNQTKEAGTVVDIGYHYVATDGSGIPLDTDGDGIPDYWEDRNGNGTYNGSETDWQTSENGTTSGGGMLQIFTVLE